MSIIDARGLDPAEFWAADACIVGAGAAGTSLAEALAAAGWTVCLLESGGFAFDEDVQSLYDLISVGHPQRNGFLSRVRYFGGSCNLWGGRSIELQPLDFEHRPWVPWSGWPIAGEEVAKNYGRARALLGLPSTLETEGALTEGEQSVFGSSGLAPTRVLSPRTPKRFGKSYRKDFVNSERIQVLLHANVTNIDLDASGRHVRQLTVKTLEGRTLRVRAQAFVLACGGLETPRLLLSSRDRQASGIGNGYDLVGRFFMDHPRAAYGRVQLTAGHLGRLVRRQHLPNGRLKLGLHASPATQQREGLLNHYLALENKVSVCAEKNYPRLIELMKVLLLRGHLRTRLQLGKAHAKDLAYLLAPDEVVPPALLAGWNLLRRARNPAPDQRSYVVVYDCEQPPNPASRVHLAHDVDRLGLNRLILDWRIDGSVQETLLHLQARLADTLQRRGLGRLEADEGPPLYADASHHMGTTRMSASPRTGVVDPDCRVHGVDNLFVAGSAVFPTAGHANPTLTILALTLRLADHLNLWLGRPQATPDVRRVA